MARRLEVANGSTYTGIEAVHAPTFHIVLRFSGISNAEIANKAKAIADPDLLGVLKVGQAPYSESALRERGRELGASLVKLGFNANIAINAASGKIKILTADPSRLLATMKSKGLSLPTGIPVEQFSGITPTAFLPGGYFYNGQTMSCTVGFTVRRASDLVKGMTTAGHCDNSAYWSTVKASTWPHTIGLIFRQEWIGNDLDVQWSTINSSEWEHSAQIFNGTSVVNITGGQVDYVGLYACKYGRQTGRTCGTVDQWNYWSPGYGWMPRLNRGSGSPPLNDFGDSGGPVFTGSLAIGSVHGKDAAGNMYYNPIRFWDTKAIGISVMCYC